MVGERITQSVVGTRIARIDFDGFTKRGNRFIYLAQVTLRAAQSKVGICVPGIDFNGLTECDNRFI